MALVLTLMMLRHLWVVIELFSVYNYRPVKEYVGSIYEYIHIPDYVNMQLILI